MTPAVPSGGLSREYHDFKGGTKSVLALPMCPYLTDAEVEWIAAALRDYGLCLRSRRER